MIKIDDLSLEEKIELWQIGEDSLINTLNEKTPSIMCADGPCGPKVNLDGVFNPVIIEPEDKFQPAVCHASGSVLANSWNKDLCYEAGKYIADEAIEKGVSLIFGPGVNIKRTPLCGRNSEYFSEDPYLAGLLAQNVVKGMQDKGIIACPKHFCCNNREFMRFGQSSEIDERALREIYLRVFQIICEVKPKAIMSSYNLVNGMYVHENKYMLNTVLRDELKFDGVIISDGGAVKDPILALKAGLNLMLPLRKGTTEKILKAYDEKVVSIEEIDYAVEPIIKLLNEFELQEKLKKVEFSQEERYLLTVKEAEEGIVLLKNEDNILPLKDNTKIAVLGIGSDICYAGGGSTRIKPSKKVLKIEDALKKVMNSEIVWHPAFQISEGKILTHILDSAYQISYGVDYCILSVFVSPLVLWFL